MEDIKEKTADEELLVKLELIINEKHYYKKLANAYQGSCVEKSKIREIKDKAETMATYGLGNVIDDLNKLFGDE